MWARPCGRAQGVKMGMPRGRAKVPPAQDAVKIQADKITRGRGRCH